MEKHKILYAEDDETIAFLTKDSLVPHYEVTQCSNGEEALDVFKSEKFDLCVFDIKMPKLDGFALVSEIRKINQEIPILFISAKTLKEDRIKGLKLGADDYLIKPFSIEELILKIEIFLRRSFKKQSVPSTVFEIGSYQFDSTNYTLSKNEKTISLTRRESELLEYFVIHQNKVIKREDILREIWGDDDYFMGRSLDVFISRLRKFFSKEDGIFIENLRSIGFRFHVKKEPH